MINHFLKFKISNALSTGRPLSRFWRQRISGSDEVRQFEHAARELDSALQQGRELSASEVPLCLHAGIMAAVREAARQDALAESVGFGAFQRRPALAFAPVLALGVGCWLLLTATPFNPRPTGLESSTAAPSVGAMWHLLGQVATGTPAVVQEPYSRQMANLSSDVRETARFLAASLP